MKKLLTLILVLLFIVPNCTANDVLRPSFKEFCPDVYYHKNYIPNDWYEPQKFTTKEKALLWSSIIICLYPAIITYPMAISDTKWRRKQRAKKIIEEYNTALTYWKEREAAFERSLDLCSKSKDKAGCYVNVKLNESNKNLMIEQNNLLQGVITGIVGTHIQQTITNTNLQQINTKLQF